MWKPARRTLTATRSWGASARSSRARSRGGPASTSSTSSSPTSCARAPPTRSTGWSPSPTGNLALDQIAQGITGRMVALQQGIYTTVPMELVTAAKKRVDVTRPLRLGELPPQGAEHAGQAHVPLLSRAGQSKTYGVARRCKERRPRLIAPFTHKTPLFHSRSLSLISGADVYIKAENLQKTGAFKVRGAFNKMARIQKGKVVAASMGNHAQAVAFAARQLGMEAIIVMPKSVSIVKEEATGATARRWSLTGRTSRRRSTTPYPLRITRSSMPMTTTCHCRPGDGRPGDLRGGGRPRRGPRPCGGGGLAAGCAVAIRALLPHTEVIGVQARRPLPRSFPKAGGAHTRGSRKDHRRRHSRGQGRREDVRPR